MANREKRLDTWSRLGRLADADARLGVAVKDLARN